MGVRELYFKVVYLLVHLFSNGRAKTKLAMLAFLYCGAFVKNSIGDKKNPKNGVQTRVLLILSLELKIGEIS